jgi:hypothetical protein
MTHINCSNCGAPLEINTAAMPYCERWSTLKDTTGRFANQGSPQRTE